jgi:hypothetical protein
MLDTIGLPVLGVCSIASGVQVMLSLVGLLRNKPKKMPSSVTETRAGVPLSSELGR